MNDPQPRPHVVYLAGFGRSGSTILERVLGAVPGWTNVGELVDLSRSVYANDERCGCGEPFRRCPFWVAVGKHAYGDSQGWNDADMARVSQLRLAVARQRNIPRLLALASGRSRDTHLAEEVREYQDHYGRVYAAIAELSGAEVIVDASKAPAHGLALGIVLPGHPDADRLFSLNMVNLVRDPRGVAYSWSRRQHDRPHSSGEPSRMWKISPRRSAGHWAAIQSEMTAIGRLSGVRVVRMRYEDLIAAPSESLTRLLGSLGLNLPADGLGHVQDNSVQLLASHGLSGNPGRFESGTTQLRPDREWQSRMPRREQRLVTATTAPWLIRYRYPLRVAGVGEESLSQGRAPQSGEVGPVDPARQLLPGFSPENAASLPLVSVVVPTRGRPELLRQTLATIVAQDYPGNMEILVSHDQEEPDPSLEELSKPGRTVRSVSNGGTPGLAGGRNFGIRETTGEIVASCDDDDLWYPAKIRKQVGRLQEDPELLAVGSGIRLLMGDRTVDWPGEYPVVTHDRLLVNRVKELHSSTMAMWRYSFAKAGEYDEDLPHGYAEDYDWLLRASRVGKVGVVNEILADIRKDVPSWFQGRARNTSAALEYLLAKHPDFVDHPSGHARILGQISYAKATGGERGTAARCAIKAISIYPPGPYGWLGLVTAATGAVPKPILRLARLLGREVL